MLNDNFNRDKAVRMYGPILVAPTIDFDTTGIDVSGYESATFYVMTGTSADTLSGSLYIYFELEESDVVGSGYTDVAAEDVISSDATPVNKFGLCDAETDESKIFALGYKGTKQFVRVHGEVTGTMTNGIYLAIFACLSHARLSSTGQVVQSA